MKIYDLRFTIYAAAALISALCSLTSALAQPTPVVKATQAEVNAGVNNSKFVTPATLANSTLIGTGSNALSFVNLGAGFGLMNKVARTAGQKDGPFKVLVIGNSMAELSSSFAARTLGSWGETLGIAGVGIDNWDFYAVNDRPNSRSLSADTNWFGAYWKLTNADWVTFTNYNNAAGFYSDRLGAFWLSQGTTNTATLLCSTNGGAWGTLATLPALSAGSTLHYTNFTMPLNYYRLRVTNTGPNPSYFIGPEFLNTTSKGVAGYFIQIGGATLAGMSNCVVNLTNAGAQIQPDLVWFALKESSTANWSNNWAVMKSLFSVSTNPPFVQGEYFEQTATNARIANTFLRDNALTNGWAFFDPTYYAQSFTNQWLQGWMFPGDPVHMSGVGGIHFSKLLMTEFGVTAQVFGGGGAALVTTSNTIITNLLDKSLYPIPPGMTYYDDFERAATAPGTLLSTNSPLTDATSINHLTQARHQYFWHPFNLAAADNAYITNGVMTHPVLGGGASYPTVDMNHRPREGGAWLVMRSTGLTANATPWFYFVISQNTNGASSLNGAYHFGILPWRGNPAIALGFWASGANDITSDVNGIPLAGGLASWATTNYLSNGTNFGWNAPQYNQPFLFRFWISGSNATFQIGDAVIQVTDPRFETYGGRYFTPEFFSQVVTNLSGANVTTNAYTLEALSVWAGNNSESPIGPPADKWTNQRLANLTNATVKTGTLEATGTITGGSSATFNGNVSASGAWMLAGQFFNSGNASFTVGSASTPVITETARQISMTTSNLVLSSGAYFPSNSINLTAAQVTAVVTNGGFWTGPMSNSWQLYGMSNNVGTWKVIWP